jgi:hypothetical protein
MRRNRSFSGLHLNPPSSTGNRPSGARGHGGSLLRQAGEAQTGDVEFENFRGHKVSVRTKAGDGQLGVDGEHSTEFGARHVEMAEMRQRDDFDPHRCDDARLVVQGAVGPFDRLFEASRDEMSGSDSSGVEKAMRIGAVEPDPLTGRLLTPSTCGLSHSGTPHRRRPS